MLLFFIIFSASVAAAEFPYPPGWEELQSDDSWELISASGQTKTFRKTIPGAALPGLKVEMITAADPEKLLDTAWDVDRYTEIFSSNYITSSKVESSLGPNHYSAWEIIDIPFLSPRIYHFQSVRKPYAIYWVKSELPEDYEFDETLLIPELNFGSWEVSVVDGKTKFIYRICVDPGGMVPDWIVEQAYLRFCQYTVIDLEKWVLEN